jgi:hypothetical protein
MVLFKLLASIMPGGPDNAERLGGLGRLRLTYVQA